MKVIGFTERQVLCVNIMGCVDEGDWSYRASGIVREYHGLY
jgi:hypothetical protein